MKIYHVEYAKTGRGMSGGETCMVELIRHFSSIGIENVILTTDNGKDTYTELGLQESEYIKFITISSYKSERYSIFLSYIYRLLLFFIYKKNIKINDADVIMCHSDFFPNSIPSYILGMNNKSKKIYWFHMLAPSVIYGYKGHFIKKLHLPNFALIHYNLNQILYKMLMPKSAKIITVNNYYKSILSKIYSMNEIYVLNFFSGINRDFKSSNFNKEYDLVWLGRFHEQKGIFEFIEILNILKKSNRFYKTLIIGNGDEKLNKLVNDKINEYGLNSYVHLAGKVTGDLRFHLLSKSKIFCMTSFYESFGIVIIEAMKCGLPVVSFNLPVFEVFGDKIEKADMFDNSIFANKIINLMEDNNYYSRSSEEALRFASNYSWTKTADEVLKTLNYEK
jgi:glycosyltransferase involved in cell wall biosynthesis